MNERERLIELLEKADKACANAKQCENCVGFGKGSECVNYHIADHLLANGIVVPLCKLEDTIYRIGDNGRIYGDWEITQIQVYPDEILYIDDSDNYFVSSDIGKTVFLTREEAEKALAEREQK